MNKLKALWVIVFVLFAIESLASSPKHNLQARKQIKMLIHVVEDGRLMFVHEDDLTQGHAFRPTKDVDVFEACDLKNVCGDYPAVYGTDLNRIERDQEIYLDYIRFNNIIESVKA
jgi:mannan endo-1,4-beta-mannosidase